MKTCKYCGKWIYWERNASGKTIPVNPDGTPHHQTCKAYHKAKAEQARRDRVAKMADAVTMDFLENPNQLHFSF